MRHWKRLLVFAMVLVLFVTGNALSAVAASKNEGPRVYDMADLFDKNEENALADQISMLQEKMDMDIVVVTTEKNSGSAMDFADEFYIENEFGFGSDYDGALFLIDMENGELWISTSGKMVRYLTDDRIDAILDAAVEYAYDGYFYDTAEVFLMGLEEFYEDGIPSNQYNYDTETGKVDRYKSIQWYEFLIAVGVAAAAGGVAVFAVLRDYGMNNDGDRMAANFRLSYRKDSAFTMGSILADVMLNSYVTRSIIQSQRRSSGGGGRRSSSGRSSTHRSSGGRKMGGGGRKFR